MLHRIRRQILELELPREQGAYALQQRASRVFQEQVLPELDKVFSRIAPADRIVRLDRLEIDLGNIGESGWERRFVERCVEQIARQVADAAFEVGEAGHQPETLAPVENAQHIAAYFLETGLLPWYAKGWTLNELEETINNLSEEAMAAFSRSLLPIFQRDERSVQRLAQQFSPVFSEKIVSLALGFNGGWVSRAVQIRQQQTGKLLSRLHRAVFFQTLLRVSGSVLQNLPPEPTVLAQFFEAEIPQPVRRKAGAKDAPSETVLTKKAVPEHLVPTNTPSAELGDEPSSSQSAQRPEDQPPSEPSTEKRPNLPIETRQSVSRKVASATAQGIVVEGAGLVLFGPYLAAFFEHLGIHLSESLELLESSPAQTRAVHLLHYLATGEERPEEHQLAFPKILCGIPLETPVPQELELSEAEKTEAGNLLEAVVRNWPALKNTSTDGLRNGFVRRNGLVRWQEDQQAWVLQVERMAQDILLDRLPWTISVVRLPWMTGMIQVEW